jgi:hypothetical protein
MNFLPGIPPHPCNSAGCRDWEIRRDHARTASAVIFGLHLQLLLKKAHRNTRWVFPAILLGLIASLYAQPTCPQNKKDDIRRRTVHGSVIDKNENPVASSAVYIMNIKTQAVKTNISDDAGNFRFSDLDPNVDYEIHAEHDDLTSATHTVSNYDTRTDVEIILKLSHPKTAH